MPFLAVSPSLLAADIAFPGYSGYLNVPSATALPHGQADVQFSDQGYMRGRYGHYKNVSGGFGVFPKVEVGGRVAWNRTQTNCFRVGCDIRDLSANIKLQAPLIPEEWFSLAAGVQDLGGEANFFDATYIVAGRSLGPVDLSAGYGDPDIEGRYLDGAFGAIQYSPVEWAGVIAEHDAQDARAGLRLNSPKGLLPFGAQVKSKVLLWNEGDSESDRRFFSVGISIPFGNEASKTHLKSVASDKLQVARGDETAPVADVSDFGAAREGSPNESYQPRKDTEKHGNTEEKRIEEAAGIGAALVGEGYEHVRVRSEGKVLTVRWENNLYNRDERDSIYDVARLVQSRAETHETARLVLTNQRIPVIRHTVPLSGDEAALYATETDFPEWQPQTDQDWDFEGSYGWDHKPRLTLRPNLSTGVATEYGVWDYSLAVNASLSASLWPGALASASYNAEVARSEDFDEDGVFYDSRQRTDFIEAEVQQTLKPHPQVYTSFHGGRYALDYNGGLNESLWLSPNGRHTLGWIVGRFQHKKFEDISRTQTLARYSYFNPDYNADVTVYGGRFFAEDQGFRVDSRFWFGDYAITLSYKDTDAQFVSLGWTIPLTPTRDANFRYGQIKGDADWNYSVQTRVNEDRNDVSFGGAQVLESAHPIRERHLNRGRLTSH
ncbi:exopolysaccharide biosynthesis protein YbjH [Tamilnaduibacter salinus]|uniref:Exopolysaccharide biosynthesis protein YbjH n=2 Tax=Tamilnaduibacter salinus TaxID=1484056 RepID=A0A2U1CUS3_9GAMM|nr:exopolysaccharide biosynthesis protein YbjH [Tamilnaduibacter salinus]